MSALLRHDPMAALCDVIRQSERAGAMRRAALLHGDKLPSTSGKQHHVRLARQAMAGLAQADRARSFELPRGRLAVVWRDGDGEDGLTAVRDALRLLLSGAGQAGGSAAAELLTTYHLPKDAALLLDDLAELPEPPGRATGGRPLDLQTLARLETSLTQADLARFVRSRPVATLPTPEQLLSEPAHRPEPMWSERYFDIDALADSLCPGRALRDERWLFRRLTRTMDARLLAALASPSEREGHGALALNLNVATLLGPDFLRFEELLTPAARGCVTLLLRAADILSDPAAFVFARNFVRGWGHRLALADASPILLRFFDAATAGFDFVQVALTPGLRDGTSDVPRLAESGVTVVLTGLDRPSDLRWAVEHGFRLGRGRAVSP